MPIFIVLTMLGTLLSVVMVIVYAGVLDKHQQALNNLNERLEVLEKKENKKWHL